MIFFPSFISNDDALLKVFLLFTSFLEGCGTGLGIFGALRVLQERQGVLDGYPTPCCSAFGVAMQLRSVLRKERFARGRNVAFAVG